MSFFGVMCETSSNEEHHRMQLYLSAVAGKRTRHADTSAGSDGGRLEC